LQKARVDEVVKKREVKGVGAEGGGGIRLPPGMREKENL
jgi:hypothetical protein